LVKELRLAGIADMAAGKLRAAAPGSHLSAGAWIGCALNAIGAEFGAHRPSEVD
jgi:hypothetical protein